MWRDWSASFFSLGVENFFFSFGFWYDERGRRWVWAVTERKWPRDYLGNCYLGFIVVNAKWRLGSIFIFLISGFFFDMVQLRLFR